MKNLMLHLLTKRFAQISLCEIHKMVPQTLRSFKLGLINSDEPWVERGTWFTKQTGIKVVVERRM